MKNLHNVMRNRHNVMTTHIRNIKLIKYNDKPTYRNDKLT